MKEVINNLTGEVIEVPEEDRELIKKEMNELVPSDILDAIYQAQYLDEKIETWKFQIKDQVKEIFKKHNIKSFENDYLSITYVGEHKSKRVDTELLKQAGIYDDFVKESTVKESLKVKIK